MPQGDLAKLRTWVARHHGASQGEIVAAMGWPLSTTQWRLNRLVEKGRLYVWWRGGRKRYGTRPEGLAQAPAALRRRQGARRPASC